MKRSRKTFLLTGGQTSEICRELTEGGLGDVMVCAGSRLSYPDEHIVKCPAKDWQAAGIPSGQEDSLTVLFLLNEKPERFLMTGIPEECFVRGQVPMTKSEVRAVIMSKLAVREDDVIYDIGAGTGSVSVELALAAGRGQVFAVECDPEGISLIRQNGEKFGCHNLTAVEGMAPEALTGLPAPDAVFIGGTKGRLDPILDAIPGKTDPSASASARSPWKPYRRLSSVWKKRTCGIWMPVRLESPGCGRWAGCICFRRRIRFSFCGGI